MFDFLLRVRKRPRSGRAPTKSKIRGSGLICTPRPKNE